MILRVNISDTTCGVVLFERVWKWQEEGRSKNIASLVQVFYQFARDVDAGEISRVSFSKPDSLFRSQNSGRRKVGSSNSGISNELQSIDMVCAKDSRVTVAVFQDELNASSKAVAQALLEAFVQQYGEQVDSMKNVLKKASQASSKNESREMRHILEKFAGFSSVVERFSSTSKQVIPPCSTPSPISWVPGVDTPAFNAQIQQP
uniref:Uncharacterized protein n=1 Tax=Cyanoptyche gloeocystis TaxID=77922 RepID=A0A7S2JM28_9EUKA|mmetsp:Transcript_2354/g.4325  ORF Transcript_2354/g.4325 Transcript_2354/m.4325 type:complete len:204 (+) Transcript_2354:82-693(+)